MKGLIQSVQPQLRDEKTVALATLVSATGSTSKKIGAKMYVGSSGRILGGVTIGGCVDSQVIEASDHLLNTGGRRLLSISLDDDEAWEIGLTCGGTVEVLIERIQPNDAHDPVVSAHARATALIERGEAAVIVTPIEPAGTPYTVPSSDLVEPSGNGRVFIDRIAPPTRLLVVGAGQIAMSLTRFARELDMQTVVIDGRERYATRERFPDADDIQVGMPSEIVGRMPAAPNVAAILIAHDYKYELPVLRQLLRSNVGYIGLLGSRKRGAAVMDLLRDEGFTSDELARIRTPIGLDIGGKSSAEVALSILAEVVAVRSGRRP
ncbi:MAG TPA: XdhC/CoxI family protein [Gemmatimonadaceae bacterium]|jgi:xanthine dehydrogenase accessory factor|nr:XdhC/CoxI family protein [Gemmatimonadaceae bacterium]